MTAAGFTCTETFARRVSGSGASRPRRRSPEARSPCRYPAEAAPQNGPAGLRRWRRPSRKSSDKAAVLSRRAADEPAATHGRSPPTGFV